MRLPDEQLAIAWQSQSLLLAYPDEELRTNAALVRRAIDRLPAPVADPLARFLDHAAATPLLDLATDFVATLDHKKRCSLFLTYYAHGDTRNRGVALLRLKQTYRRAGLLLVEDELPDHLAVVLEFAAASDSDAALRLLCSHRAGIELLRLALREENSPWTNVLESVCATLPELRGDELTAVARLAAEGPPEEQVGLAPFAPPEYMPEPAGGRR
ncbi:MAG: nitrate reductase molybdenum cofactor assembly chaperone [Pseudonocardiales bacterium]|nr:MAG: nitrate reductase molybdenum cofactor assembly chaperone [Pseudonocardiales bacterium]